MHCSTQTQPHTTHDWLRAPSTPLGVRSRDTPVLDLSEVLANTSNHPYLRYEDSTSSYSPLDNDSPTEHVSPSVKIEEYLDYVERQSPSTDFSFDIAFEDDLVPYQTRKQQVLGPDDSLDALGLDPRPTSSCNARDAPAPFALDDLVATEPMAFKPSLLLDGHFVPTCSHINLSTSPLKSQQADSVPGKTAEPRAVLGDFAAPTSSPLALGGLGLGLNSYTRGSQTAATAAADVDEDVSDDEMDGSHSSSMDNASPPFLRTPHQDHDQLGMDSYPASLPRSYPSGPQYKQASGSLPEHSYGPYPVVIQPPSGTLEASFPSPTLHRPGSFPPKERQAAQRERRARESASTEYGTPSADGKRRLGGANARVGDDKERQRIFHACDACRKRKAKCDAGDPCGRCTQKKVDCHYSDVRNMRGQNKQKKPPGSRKEAAAVRAAGSRFARPPPILTGYAAGPSSQPGSSRLSGHQRTVSDGMQSAAAPSFTSSQSKNSLELLDDESSWSDSEGMSARTQPQWTSVKSEVEELSFESQQNPTGMEVEVTEFDMQAYAPPQQQGWAPSNRPLSKSDPVKSSHLPLASPPMRQDGYMAYPAGAWSAGQRLASPPIDPRPMPLTAPANTYPQASSYFDMQHSAPQYQGYGNGHLYTDGSINNLQRYGLAPGPSMQQQGYFRASFAGMPTQYGHYMSPNPTSYQSTPLQGGQATLMAESPVSDHPPLIGIAMTGMSYSTTTSHVRAMSMAEGGVDRALKTSGSTTLSPPHPRMGNLNGSSDPWPDATMFPQPSAAQLQPLASTSFMPTPATDQGSDASLRPPSAFATDLNATPLAGTPDPAAVAASSISNGAGWSTQNQDYFNSGTPPTDAAWPV